MTIRTYVLPDEAGSMNTRKGSNLRRILIVGTTQEVNEHFNLLSKILRAVGCDIENDTHVLTLDEEVEISLFSSNQIKDYDRILNFGIPTRRLGLSIDLKLPRLKLQSLILINGPSLHQLASDDKTKRQYWQLLKTEFEI